uniref:ZAD domain-containing protein n=1 Tax=Anopheles minimus TaxID=112268 RepID=A0A182WNS9_9DIPT
MSSKCILSIPVSIHRHNMTRDSSTCSDTTRGEDSLMDAIDAPDDAQFPWCEETIVKSEVIISSDGLLPAVGCRLCDSTDHLCSPIYNLRGGSELTENHLDTIYRLSDITITYEKDHASVVCSYCLLKIEEYTVIREIWQMKNQAKHVSSDFVPVIKPAILKSCTEQIAMKDASTQTTVYRTLHTAADVRDASTSTVNYEPVPVPENNTSLRDDGAVERSSTQCETIDVEQYCKRMKRKRKHRQSKEQLIEEVMQIVKKQFRLDTDETTV